MWIFFTATKSKLKILLPYLLTTLISMYQIVSGQFDTVQKLVGESVTLSCQPSFNVNNDFPISWYRRNSGTFVSNDSIRFLVACERGFFTDSCSLTINRLTIEDADTYVCLYYDDTAHTELGGMILAVSYEELPSDDSPVCEIYEAAGDGGYILSNKRKDFQIGDEIFLRCAVFDSDIQPSLSWIREQENNITDLTPYVTLRSLFQPVNLNEMDVGAHFVCLMTHPAVSETRNCSLTPLPASISLRPTNQLVSNMTTTYLPVASKSLTSETNNEQATTHSNTSQSQQTSMLLVIIAVLVTLVVIVTLALVLSLVKKKKRNNQNMLSENAKDEKDELNTTNYTELNLPETKNRTYEELKKANDVDDAYESPNFVDEETTLGNDCYEVAAVTDNFEREPNETNQDSRVTPSTYANLQRPVRAINFNV